MEPLPGDRLQRAGDSGRAWRIAFARLRGGDYRRGQGAKFAQRFTEKLNMGRRETAMLCILMLRVRKRSVKSKIAPSASMLSRIWTRWRPLR